MKAIIYIFLVLVFSSAGSLQAQDTLVNPKSKFTIDISYGYTFRTAKIDAGLSGVERELTEATKTGTNLSIEPTYRINDFSSIGLLYNRFNFSASISNVQVDFDDGSQSIGSLGNSGHITFIGPKYNYHLFTINDRGVFRFGTGLGYLGYVSELSLDSTFLAKQEGSTLGVVITASYYHNLSKSVAIGINIGYIAGGLGEIKQTDLNGNVDTVKLDDDSRESLSQLNTSIGLRFYL